MGDVVRLRRGVSLGLDTEIIARLLLDFAPAPDLWAFGLSEETMRDWVAKLDSERRTKQGAFHVVGISALALHYATRKPADWKKRARYRHLEIDLCTLVDFAKMVKLDEFDEVTEILKEVRHEEGRKRIKKAQGAPRPVKHDWEAVGKLVAELLGAGRSERELSGIIKTRLGVPQSTFRDWRRKTTVP